MKDIILVTPPLTLEETLGETLKDTGSKVPPLGLCNLAAVLREKSFDVSILDAAILGLTYEEAIETILKENPRSVGITAVTISIYNAAKLAKMIKDRDKDITIIIGGPHITSVAEETMIRFPQFDIGVIGEGERTILELVKTIREQQDLKDVRGLIVRERDKLVRTGSVEYILNLDELPYPAWDLLPELPKFYVPSMFSHKRLPSTSLITSRGCPGRCTFCDRSVFGNRWRGFSADYIIRMIKKLIDYYGIIDLNILDDVFLLNKKRIIEICKRIITEGIDITWNCSARIDLMNGEILRFMKESGCWQVNYGIESGSQVILDNIRKDVKKEKIKEAVRMTHDAGMRVKGLFMVGNPGETRDTIQETLDFIEELKIEDVSISAFTPLPGSEIYENAREYGSFEDDWKRMNLWEPLFIPKGLSKEDLVKVITRLSKK